MFFDEFSPHPLFFRLKAVNCNQIFYQNKELYGMLKQVVFDLGGVVVDYDPHSYLADRFLNKPLEDFLYEKIFASDTWRDLNAGRITLARATELILAACGTRRYEGQMVLDDWRDMLTTKRDTVRLMEELKNAGYPLYYLSDISQDVLDIFRRRKSFMPLFSGGAASCEEQLLKPDPAFFRVLLERYHLQPSETVFIDDRKENIDAANALGMTAIPFRDSKDLRQTLLFLGFPLKTGVRRSHKSTSGRKKKTQPDAASIKAIFKPGKQPQPNQEERQTDLPL